MTKIEVLNAMATVAEVSENKDFMAYIQNELVLLDKKNAHKSVNKDKVANDNLRVELLDFIGNMGTVQISDITDGFEALNGATSQRVSGLLSPMVKSGQIVRTKNGKNTFYTLA